MTAQASEAVESRQLAYLRLARLRGVGPILVKRLLEAMGSAEAVLAAHPAALAAVEGIGTIKASQIVASRNEAEKEAREELARIRADGVTLLTPADAAYPPALKTIHDPPLVLYVRGEIQPTDAVAIGIVGARECTLYGREQATKFGAQLAEAGLTVVSGGARGIDTCAHLGALRSNGRTIVVLGCGLRNTYPPENKDLYKRIVDEEAGAIVTEFPLDTPPNRENFPPRNRIIAGMSLGIVVIEANLKSGSLITARLAAADYGREVFAVPGRVDSPASAGTHHLIKSMAAHLVESAGDVLDHLGDVGSALKTANAAENAAAPAATLFHGVAAAPAVAAPAALSSVQMKIVAALGAGAMGVDELVDATGMPPQVIMAEMTLLTLRGAVVRSAGNRFANK